MVIPSQHGSFVASSSTGRSPSHVVTLLASGARAGLSQRASKPVPVSLHSFNSRLPSRCLRPGSSQVVRAASGASNDAADGGVAQLQPAVLRAYQLKTGNAVQTQHHAAVAAVASPAITVPGARGTVVPGIVMGALLTVALQKAWNWVQKQAWAQAFMEVLDLKPVDELRDASPGAHSSTIGTSSSGVYTVQLPDTPEVRDAVSSLQASLSRQGSSQSQELDAGESVEWVNMCWRKMWRVYQRGLERWITDLLQPVFDGLVTDGSVPKFVQRLRIVEFTLDHEAPYFSNMRRRYSRKDSDLTGVVDLRYTGGARLLLMLEIGSGRWKLKIPVMVSDLDLDCQFWIKLRLAPMCPWIGSLSLAFVGPPNVKIQLSPYNRVRLMRIPVLQNFLRKLFTVDLPGLMVLPKRLDVAIPPSVTSVAEAAVGRDTIMRAVASAVLQADALEQALIAALPLGPQTPAGGISLPEAFVGELDIVLREARDLPVWGFPGQSNPYVRLALGEQAVQSRREHDTSAPGRHRHPVWNQEFQFLVESPDTQVLEIVVRDSHLTGRVDVGSAKLELADIIAAKGQRMSVWLPLLPPLAYVTRGPAGTYGEVLVEVTYKSFVEDEDDTGYREAETSGSADSEKITDIRSAAAASSRAAVAASAAISAIAMTKAAAARAATRAARAAQAAASSAAQAAGLQTPSTTSDSPDQKQLGASSTSEFVDASPSASREATPTPPPPSAVQSGSDTDDYDDGMAPDVPSIAARLQAENGSPPPTMKSEPSTTSNIVREVFRRSDSKNGNGNGRVSHADYIASTSSAAVHDSSFRTASQLISDAPSTSKPDNRSTRSRSRSADRDDHYDDDDDSWHRPGSSHTHKRHRDHTAGQPVREHVPNLDTHRTHGGLGESVTSAVPSTIPHTTHNTVTTTSTPQSISGIAQVKRGGASVLTQPVQTAASEVQVLGKSIGTVTAVLEPPISAVGSPLPLSDTQESPLVQPAVSFVASSISINDTLVGSAAASAVIEVNPLATIDVDSWPVTGSMQEVANGESVSVASVSEASVQETTKGAASVSAAVKGLPSVVAAVASEGTSSDHSSQSEGATAQQTVETAKSSMDASSPTYVSTQQLPLPLLINRVHDLGLALGSAYNAAMDKARDSLSPRQPPKTDGTQSEASSTDVSSSAAVDDEGNSPIKFEQRSNDSWVAPILAALSVFTSNSPPQATPKDSMGSTQLDSSTDSTASAQDLHPASESSHQKPWWDFWGKPSATTAVPDAAPTTGKTESVSTQSQDQSGGDSTSDKPSRQEGRPWWAFWEQDNTKTESDKSGGQDGQAADHSGSQGSGDANNGSKPVEAIIIPPDLPIEEIAREVAKLKDESWRSKEEHVETLWAKAVEKNDRPWIMLCAALLAVACALLATVAWRLEHPSGTSPEDVIVPMATIQLMLQLLQQ